MDEEHKKYNASVESRISAGKFNMLAMAAPLETSSYSSSRGRHSTPAESKKAEEPKEIPNQRLGILHALLSVGALRPAIAMISQYPWIVDAHQELCDLMIRILEHSISSLYERMVVLRKPEMKDFTSAKARWGASGLIPSTERKPHVTLTAPEPPCTIAVNFVFFFSEWARYIPVCQTEEDLVNVVEPLMKFIAPYISRGYVFLTKFIRIGRIHLATSAPNVSPFVMTICCEYNKLTGREEWQMQGCEERQWQWSTRIYAGSESPYSQVLVKGRSTVSASLIVDDRRQCGLHC